MRGPRDRFVDMKDNEEAKFAVGPGKSHTYLTARGVGSKGQEKRWAGMGREGEHGVESDPKDEMGSQLRGRGKI